MARLAEVDETDQALTDTTTLEDAPDDRTRTLIAHGMDDIAAMLEPGLRALLAVTAQGRDAKAAAITLWEEFLLARRAVIGLAAQR
ncbi:MAG: hypothetical protein DI637_10330 [Citromicrobium sp.]|nr:MAG: hypothetical protein DI637_10330 [Citromicrobium sp.]